MERFDALVRPILADLFRFARRLTRDPVTAEDLLQQSLEKGFARIGHLRDEGAFKAWQSRVLYTTWLDARAKRREEPVESEQIERQEGRMRPDATVAARQLGNVISQAFDRLPDEQRCAVWLVDGQGHTFTEAAQILGIPEGTAASRVARARRSLRRWLADVAAEQGVGR